MKSSILCFVFIAVAVPGVSGAQPGERDGAAVDTYQGPGIEERAMPDYPVSQVQRGKEGWVRINFMVDTDGRAYEPNVVEHVGDEAFVEAAKEALEETVFAPATSGDEAVDASSTITYRFMIEGGENGARRRFANQYDDFMSTLETGSAEEAIDELEALEELDIYSNYEYAYLSLARYYFARQHEPPRAQMTHLERALGESIEQPEQESFLAPEMAEQARRALFLLQARTNFLAEALDTWRLMKARGDEEGLERFRDVYDQLTEFQADDEAYGVAGRLKEAGSWHVDLFSSSFYLDAITGGRVDELKLRCDQRYVFFEFDSETQYNVADGAGECSLEVVGEPGTTFTLVQL